MLHKRTQCFSGNDMGKVGILLAFAAGIGTSVVFQNSLRLRNNYQFPVDQFFADELKGTATFVAGSLDSGKSITISSTGRFSVSAF